jgi:dynein heavy chain, axonemal
MRETTLKLNRGIEDLEDVRVAMGVLHEIRSREADIDSILGPIEDIYTLLSRYQVQVPKEGTCVRLSQILASLFYLYRW